MPTTTHEVVMVHRMLRREFRAAAGRVRGVRHGSRAQVRLVADRLALLLDTLHQHYRGEDALLWPELAERLPEHGELWKRMWGRHAELSALLGRAGALIGPWAAAGASAHAEELATAFDQVSRAVEEHFDVEEREVLPLVPAVVSRAEWDGIGAAAGAAAAAAVPGRKLLTVLGMILKEAEPGEQVLIMARVPLAPRVRWRAVGERNYRRLEQRLEEAVGHG
ncbi:hemerythrin domain-containing protein [Streptomyces sp. NPDC006430]|uniref:hemerythrin domain-containing protein n=1 Tax=Streptomyces sp. NPDC006430 TaxID=3154299 RepID=UPI0033A280DF